MTTNFKAEWESMIVRYNDNLKKVHNLKFSDYVKMLKEHGATNHTALASVLAKKGISL
jgi:hypothetical protein